eukprot:sb/3477924/
MYFLKGVDWYRPSVKRGLRRGIGCQASALTSVLVRSARMGQASALTGYRLNILSPGVLGNRERRCLIFSSCDGQSSLSPSLPAAYYYIVDPDRPPYYFSVWCTL